MLRPIATLGAGSGPYDVRVVTGTDLVLASSYGTSLVSVFDGTSNAAAQTVTLPAGTEGIGINQSTLTGYVANSAAASVSVLGFGPITSVTVQTSPAGQSITVDGAAYTAPQTFTWLSSGTALVCPSLRGGEAGNMKGLVPDDLKRTFL